MIRKEGREGGGGGEMIREGEEENVNIMNCNCKSQSKASFKRKMDCSLKQKNIIPYCVT